MTTDYPEMPREEEPREGFEESLTEAIPGSDEPTHHMDAQAMELPEAAMDVPQTEEMPVSPEQVTEQLAETDEVYVILPEDDIGDIPVVETEVVEGDWDGEDLSDSGGITESIEGELAEDVGLLTELPTGGGEGEPPEAAATEMAAPTEDMEDFSAEVDDLDEIASELDDEVLGYDADGMADDEIPMADDMDGEAGEYDYDAGAVSAPRRSRVKMLMAAAALLSVAAVGGYYGWQYYQQQQAAGGGQTVAHVAPPPPVDTTAGTPALPDNPTGVPSDSTGAGGAKPAAGTAEIPSDDPIELARAAFREKFVLALELGFAGEVGHE